MIPPVVASERGIAQTMIVAMQIKSKRGDHHGIGLLNVKAVVDKYGGDMVLSCDENEFKAVVIL